MVKVSSEVTYKMGYVLMLDVLGFKESITPTYSTKFLEIWNDIRNTLIKAKQDCEKENTSENLIMCLDLLCLSDTILIGVSLEPNKAKLAFVTLYSLVKVIEELVFNCMTKYKLFFRGALSYGEYLVNDDLNIAFGPAINEAAAWYETTDWCGIVLTPSAEYRHEYLLSLPEEELSHDAKVLMSGFVRKYKIPFKPGVPNACHYALLWFMPSLGGGKDRRIWESLTLSLSSMAHHPVFALKHSNTVDFVKYILKDTPVSKFFNSYE